MLRKLRPRSAYDVIALLALFIAVGGGTAFAVVAANQVNSASIIDKEVKNQDLSLDVRTRKLEYRRSNADDTKRTVLTLGNLQIGAHCSGVGSTYLRLYVKNISSQAGELNAGFLHRSATDSTFRETYGVKLASGDEIALRDDGSNATDSPLLQTYSRGAWDKAEGQLILRTPGRVTTVTFHAQATFIDERGSYFDRKECNADGTAVSATS